LIRKLYYDRGPIIIIGSAKARKQWGEGWKEKVLEEVKRKELQQLRNVIR
jgi:hypothetical protein